MTGKIQWLVVSDLDGSLLNHHDYSWQEAVPTIRHLQKYAIPIIFNTSKTYFETIELQREMDITAPFIVENGSCLYLPKMQFQELPSQYADARNGFWEIKYGNTLQEINRHLKNAVTDKDDFIRLSECSAEEASELTGLSIEQAKNAINREFSQPVLWKGNDRQLDDFIQRLHKHGLNVLQGGRFLHIQGKTDKGYALEKLRIFFSRPLKTVVIGDSANDLAMLEKADIPIVVKAPGNKYLLELMQPSFVTSSEAPKGWTEAVGYALKQMT